MKTINLNEIKETPFNGMIRSAFWMAGKIPVAGRVATKVFEKSDFEVKAKDFANKFFNPFYATKKLSAN